MSSASRKVSVASDAKLLLLNIGITEISCVDTMTHPRPLTVVDKLYCVGRQLQDGTLDENGLLDGSRVILLPSVETGLLVSTSPCVDTSILYTSITCFTTITSPQFIIHHHNSLKHIILLMYANVGYLYRGF